MGRRIKQPPTLYRIDERGHWCVWGIELAKRGQHRSYAGYAGEDLKYSDWTVYTRRTKRGVVKKSVEQIARIQVAKRYRRMRGTGYSIEGPKNIPITMFRPRQYWTCPELVYSARRSYSQPLIEGLWVFATTHGIYTREWNKIQTHDNPFSKAVASFDEEKKAVVYIGKIKDDVFYVYDGIATAPSRRLHTFTYRLLWLESVKDLFPDNVKLVPTTQVKKPQDSDKLIDQYYADGYAGQFIARDLAHEGGYTWSKLFRRQAMYGLYECVEVVPGVGKYVGTVKFINCRTTDGDIFQAQIAGSLEDSKKFFLDPELVVGKKILLRYYRWTASGRPFKPSFTGQDTTTWNKPNGSRCADMDAIFEKTVKSRSASRKSVKNTRATSILFRPRQLKE